MKLFNDSVLLDDAGFAVVEDGKTAFRVDWSCVERIIAYKEDLWSTDLICLGFYIDGNLDRCYHVREEAEGWSDLLTAVAKRFEVELEWHLEVAQPPFARCERTIWSRRKS